MRGRTVGGRQPVDDIGELERAVRDWRLSKEESERSERRVSQYGVASATALGIDVASGGLFSIANALSGLAQQQEMASQISLPLEAALILGGLIAISTLVFFFSVILLINALYKRQIAESQADGHLRQLIPMVPDRFLPTQDEPSQ